MKAPEGYFYDGGGRREAVDALFDGAQRSDVVTVLVGAAGSGRSAVLHRFQEEADPQVLAIACVTGDILMSPDNLLAALAAALGETSADDPRDALWRAVARCREENCAVVLVVDDAHELAAEARATVSAFARVADVALVLAGDESLAPGMDPEVAFEVVALQPLSEDEAEAFVAGWLDIGDEDEMPSHRSMARLYRHSAGLPGRLAGLLGSGAAERGPLLPNRVPFWHALIAGGALLLLVVLLLYVAAEEPVVEAQTVAVPLPPPTILASGPGRPPARTTGAALVPEPFSARPYVPAEPKPAAEQAVALPPPVGAPASAPAGAVPVALPPPPPPLVATHAPGARLTATPVAAAAPVTENPRSGDEQALLAEPRSRYTVQLFASFNEQAVRQFALRHSDTRIRMFRTVREELPWYVAVTGSFRSREEAREAVLRLPLDLQTLKPWARSLQGIQDELRRRRD